MAKKASAKMDLTSMSDVTFMLVIFFVICTEIASQEIAQLELPSTIKSVVDDAPKPERLVINIVRYDDAAAVQNGDKPGAGYVSIRAEPYDFKRNKDKLVKLLRLEAFNANGKKLKPEEDGASPREVILRADRGVNYEYFQKLIQLCALDQQVRIYKLQIAIKKVNE
ncbi:MAG: biopolymer transporter ExbD [Planctomycetes bacterium]|nr:biopolymer transporter ExbD [Planctomycetota bacterium]